MASILIAMGFLYTDSALPSDKTPRSVAVIIMFFYARFMLRSETMFEDAVPPIKWPGVPEVAVKLAKAFRIKCGNIVGGDRDGTRRTGEQAMRLLLHGVSLYYTATDTLQDMTLRWYLFLRYGGLEDHDIASTVRKVFKNSTKGVYTPSEWLALFKVKDPSSTPPVGQLLGGSSMTISAADHSAPDFASSSVGPVDLSSATVDGFLLSDLNHTNAAVLNCSRLLAANGSCGIVTGVAASRMGDENTRQLTLNVRYIDNNVDVPVSVEQVFKERLAYDGCSSQQLSGTGSADALKTACAAVTQLNHLSQNHKCSDVMNPAATKNASTPLSRSTCRYLTRTRILDCNNT
jgi:hypothetical protein